MPNLKKIQIVNQIAEKLKKNPNFALVNFGNLSHQKLEVLRRKLRPLSASFQVVKNSLFKVAAKKTNKKEIAAEEVLKGNSALLTLPLDWAKGLSAFYQFAKNENQVLFKIGIIDEKIYQREDLVMLAQLPSRDELIGKILTAIKSPPTRLVYTMKFGMVRLVGVLSQKLKIKS
jgi:large subunit ribosomal protein L10